MSAKRMGRHTNLVHFMFGMTVHYNSTAQKSPQPKFRVKLFNSKALGIFIPKLGSKIRLHFVRKTNVPLSR